MDLIHFTKTLLCSISGTVILSTSTVIAGDEAKLILEEQRGSKFDNLWGLATLYKGDENTFIQSLVFTGRLKADATLFYPDEYDKYEKLLWRRARGGAYNGWGFTGAFRLSW